MSDSNTSNPRDNQEGEEQEVRKYEMLTAYIDNELQSPEEISEIEAGLKRDPDLQNRLVFEKLVKKRLKDAYKKTEVPVYLQKSIGSKIDEYIKLASTNTRDNSLPLPAMDKQPIPNLDDHKNSLKRYFLYGSAVFVLLIITAFGISSFLKKEPLLASNDLVSVSRKVFDGLVSGQVPLQIKSNNARTLADSMNKYLDFKVFIPDVKDVELVGGTCNEINGEKLAHIVHKKGNTYIYTLQGNKSHVMNENSKIVLCPDFMENVTKGVNWFACLKDENAVAVIWFRDEVICSSVADMDSKEIAQALTNFKNE